VAMWLGVERLVVDCDGQRVEIHRGRVCWPDDEMAEVTRPSADDRPTYDGIAEILDVDRWIRRHAEYLHVAHVTGELASRLPRIEPRVSPR
jgi:acyl carrier protein phosphodiesterase